MPVLQPPPLAATGRDFEVQAAAIEKANGSCGGLRLANGSLGKGHGGNFLERGQHTPNLAPSCPRLQAESTGMIWHEKAPEPWCT